MEKQQVHIKIKSGTMAVVYTFYECNKRVCFKGNPLKNQEVKFMELKSKNVLVRYTKKTKKYHQEKSDKAQVLLS